ncbi:hypothetical protein AB0K53_32250 [Streptomyces tuirus]|uniref:hypothetical protein n=1 Tax=Streptomyces tuirus TaxID=68278 RepID=UPI003436CBA7
MDVVFRAAGIEGVPRRLEDMTRAARAHRTARERDLQAREPLRELLDVACRPDSSAAAAAAAEAVRGAARRLLDVPVWEELQHEESAALAALARLIRLGRQADAATEILALQGQVVRVLPTCAMAVLIAPELTLDQPVDGDPYPAGTDEAHGTPEPADAETTAEHETVQSAASTEAIAPQPAAEPEATTTTVPVHAPKEDAGPAVDSDSAPAPFRWRIMWSAWRFLSLRARRPDLLIAGSPGVRAEGPSAPRVAPGSTGPGVEVLDMITDITLDLAEAGPIG